ncbi:MAG TPA: hypothetical protein VFD39_08870, partial [Trueperaceae bacterium]|nr:hypothetical protein [Trueperaceae bacterium]
DSESSLLVSGEVGTAFGFPWAGTMFMPGAQPFGPADLSSKPNLHFWAKGEGDPYRIQLFCQNLGQVPAETSFETAAEWQEYDVALGEVGGCDVSGLMAVIFSAGQPGEFSFQIDDVEFR